MSHNVTHILENGFFQLFITFRDIFGFDHRLSCYNNRNWYLKETVPKYKVRPLTVEGCAEISCEIPVNTKLTGLSHAWILPDFQSYLHFFRNVFKGFVLYFSSWLIFRM